MEHSITTSELLTLLLIFWAPVFTIVAFAQYIILSHTPHRIRLILIAFVSQIILAFIFWLTPVHKLFITLDLLGGYAIGSIPLQAGILSAVIITLVLWLSVRIKTLTNRSTTDATP